MWPGGRDCGEKPHPKLVSTVASNPSGTAVMSPSAPLERAKSSAARPVTLRLTLALMVLGAAGYVAAISIYIAVRIAPTAAALQNFRQETTVWHDSSERLATLDAALRDAL